MTFDSQDLKDLLLRTDLSISFEEFIKIVGTAYSLGKVYSYAPILEGYEDANIKISAEKGEFVLKIFTKEKTLPQIKSYVTVLQKAKELDIPFVKLVKGFDGFLSNYRDDNSTVYYFLSVFFNGKNFESYTPSLSEIRNITRILARINTIDIQITDSYDSWSNKNLVKEYANHEQGVSAEVKDFIHSIVVQMRRLDTFGFSASIIHGDFQRKHVFKNDKGEYCILDLGCLRHDAKVYDLSVHLAWFCLGEDTWEEREKVVEAVLDEYMKVNKLSEEELSCLPLLTQASYASYLLKTFLLIKAGDTSDETLEWYRQSKKMLQLMSEWNWKI